MRPGVAAPARGGAGGRATARGDRHAADRHRLRRRAVGRAGRGGSSSAATRRSRARAARADRRRRRWTSARSPCSSSRPSGRASRRRPRSRRRAGWPRRSSRRTTRSSSRARLDETDQARALLEERPGRRHRRGARHRPGDRARGARRPARAGPVPRDRRRRSTRRPGSRRSLADERRPLLRELGARAPRRCRRCASTLARSFDPVGELLDTASPRLGGLRAAVRVAYDRLRRRLDALVGSELGGALQEPIVTLRNGRYVVPVKAEARSRVKGIVHDASGSGQTLFIEPLVAVELGQRLARGAGRRGRGDRAHPRRAVGASWRPTPTPLRETLEALARFDFWAAKAQLAAEMDGVPRRDRRPARGRPAVGAPSRA